MTQRALALAQVLDGEVVLPGLVNPQRFLLEANRPLFRKVSIVRMHARRFSPLPAPEHT